jgi:hypothetical protein
LGAEKGGSGGGVKREAGSLAPPACGRQARNDGVMRWTSELVEEAVEDGGDLADFRNEFGKFFGEDGLHAVREGFFGFVVNFNEKAIGAHGDGGAGERKNFVAFAGAVRGIDKDGKMAAFLDGGDDGEIEGVAREIGEGADAAFAEHNVVVAFAKDVFGGH